MCKEQPTEREARERTAYQIRNKLMAVDVKLNKMIDALDERMKSILIDDVDLSVRTLRALKNCGVHTLHDAQMAVINRQLHKQHGIGPKGVKEVEELIFNISAALPTPRTKAKREVRLERVLEMFLSWTGALAQVGSATPEAWRELVVLRQEAEVVLRND